MSTVRIWWSLPGRPGLLGSAQAGALMWAPSPSLSSVEEHLSATPLSPHPSCHSPCLYTQPHPMTPGFCDHGGISRGEGLFNSGVSPLQGSVRVSARPCGAQGILAAILGREPSFLGVLSCWLLWCQPSWAASDMALHPSPLLPPEQCSHLFWSLPSPRGFPSLELLSLPRVRSQPPAETLAERPDH